MPVRIICTNIGNMVKINPVYIPCGQKKTGTLLVFEFRTLFDAL